MKLKKNDKKKRNEIDASCLPLEQASLALLVTNKSLGTFQKFGKDHKNDNNKDTLSSVVQGPWKRRDIGSHSEWIGGIGNTD